MADKKTAPAPRFPLYFAVIFSFIAVFLYALGAFDGFENHWQDTMFRIRGMRPADPRILIVTIDDETIQELGQFPFRRRYYAALLDKLAALKVRAVGVDVMFVDPSPNPEDDRAVAEATRRFKKVVHAVDINPVVTSRLEFRYPIRVVLNTGARLGLVNANPDSDNIVRRVLLFWEAWDPRTNSKKRLPVLGLATLAAYEGRPLGYYEKKLPENMLLNIRGQKNIPVINPTTGMGEYAYEYGFKRVSMSDILDGRLRPEEKRLLKGSMVLVGSTARGAYDHYPSPFFEQTPGVEVHANVIDNVLAGRYLRPVPPWATVLLVFFMAFLGVFFIRQSPLVGAGLTLGFLSGWSALDYRLFLRDCRLDFVAPALTLFLTYVVLLVQKALAENREKRQIKNMFGQYVAPEVVEILVRDPSKLKLGGDKREMTAFFLDIAHFTNISEKMDPEALIKFLNDYLSALTDVIQKNKGVVDKYIGDCIMAFWNAPLDEPNHRQLACLSAVECIQGLEQLNRKGDHHQLSESPSVRIGLNSGQMTVGNTGSVRKKAYTVIGDEVNLASRLEGANKFFGSRILASESAYGPARGVVEARELGRIRVVGKETPIRVYELLSRRGELEGVRKKMLELHQEGYGCFGERRYKEAARLFKEILALEPQDGPSQLYRHLSEDYVAAPPPADWDGVFNLTAK